MNGCREASRLIAEARDEISAQPDTEIQYIEVADPETLRVSASPREESFFATTW